jgi:hypothetical protein
VRRTAATSTAIARAKLNGADDLEPLYRDHATAKIADFVERTLATAPPLTDAQLDRIAAILRRGRAA